MKKPIYLDALFALMGIFVSLAIFVAQGGGKTAVANLIPIIPILSVGILIGGHRLLLYIQRLRGALSLVLNARSKSTMVIKITNVDGDVWLEKKFRIEAMGGASVLSITKNEVLFSEVPIAQMPPSASVISSSYPKTALRPRYVDSTQVEVCGVKNYKYEWRYEIVPPIKGKGAFIEFHYQLEIPKCETVAFTKQGGKLFYAHSAFDMEAEVSLISPTGYRIEILKTYVERFDGSQTACTINPDLQSGGHVLIWKPPYHVGGRSVCDYRLISN